MNKKSNRTVVFSVFSLVLFAMIVVLAFSNGGSIKSITGFAVAPECFITGTTTMENELDTALAEVQGAEAPITPSPAQVYSEQAIPKKVGGYITPELTQVPVALPEAVTDARDVGDAILKKADANVFGAKRLDAIAQSAGEVGAQRPATVLTFETNGFQIKNVDPVTGEITYHDYNPTGSKVLNELQAANSGTHEEGNLVIQQSLNNYNTMGDEIVKRYNLAASPDMQIKRVDGYLQVGTRGAGVAVIGNVDPQLLQQTINQVAEDFRPKFLNGLPATAIPPGGEIRGFRVGIGTSESVEQAYAESTIAFGGRQTEGGVQVGAKSTTAVMNFNEIDQAQDFPYLEYARQAPGIDTPDANGITLRQKFAEAQQKFIENPTQENRAAYQQVVNDINTVASTNVVTGAPTREAAAALASQQGRAVAGGGEETYVYVAAAGGKAQQRVYSDADFLGIVNKQKRDALAASVQSGQVAYGDLLNGVQAVGSDVDQSLAQMQKIIQQELDASGGQATVEVVNRMKDRIASEVKITRSFAMYNSADGVISASSRADPVVTNLVNNGELRVGNTAVSLDVYNEMVLSVPKQTGKNGVAVLETLSPDGTTGIIRLYNSDFPNGIQVKVKFDLTTRTVVTQ